MILACAPSVSAQGAPTLEEVTAAVDDYFADDARAHEVRTKLAEWGDLAIPHLRALAGEPSALPDVMTLQAFSMLGDHRLTCAIDAIGTDAALQLLMDIADGKTGVDPDNGLDKLEVSAAHKYEQRLRDDPHFKALVLRSTISDDPLDSHRKSMAASTIADLGWVDAAEVVEALIDDPDLHVAESAARAYFKLTGRVVEVRRPALHFPGVLEGRPPLSAPVDVPSDRSTRDFSRPTRLRASFGSWLDGRLGLLRSNDGSLTLAGRDGSDLERWDLTESIAALESYELPDGDSRWLVGLTTAKYGDAVSAFESRDWKGATRWRFEPKQSNEASIAPLYDLNGACAIAIGLGGDDGVVCFDDAGKQLWSLWNPVVYEVSSHPELPGHLLICGGALQLVDLAGKPVTPITNVPTATRDGSWLYAHHALLFPDSDGRTAILASGVGLSSKPALARLDEGLGEVWRATLPTQVSGLAMLEPENGRRLFAAVTRSGELLLFDENGRAYEPVRLVEAKPGTSVSIHAMDAGPFEDGSWGLAVGLLDRTMLFVLE